MQTHFLPELLSDPDMARSEKILRTCVHCGLCTATCPTFLLTGDELDSPRGRIYLIKEMLEKNQSADARTAYHLDRCLTCLSCMTTCPSGVDYMRLVDHARAHVETTFARPLADRIMRDALAFVLSRPGWFRVALRMAALARPLARFLPTRFANLLALAPERLPSPSGVDRPRTFAVSNPRKMRVALLNGCAQTVLDTAINEATVRLLTRFGVEVVVSKGAGCCGALAQHLGKPQETRALARRNVEAWTREIDEGGLDHVVINTSGCGAHVKDYGHVFRDDPALSEPAARIAALARDVSEILLDVGFAPSKVVPKLRVAYHAACSLQHGQKITQAPVELLRRAGFEALSVPEGHICCGSAGTYNLLQAELAQALRDRKVENIERLAPHVIAAGNLGCMVQIASGTSIPVAHTVELLDFASGGPAPKALAVDRLAFGRAQASLKARGP